MDRTSAKKLDEQYIVQTYGRYDLTVDHAIGAKIYDRQGKEYIDFASGIGVLSLGSADSGWISAVTAQMKKTQHVSNYFYSEPASRLAQRLSELSGLSRVFFANSGAESNEGAIKTARKYSYDKYGTGRNVIVTLRDSFHGRTITTLSATGQDCFHDFFFPFTEGFRYVPANDIAALEGALTDDVCAVLCEPIQGEGGVNPLTRKYVREMQRLCETKDILVIFDEVQTGIGRIGSMFAYEAFDVLPDIVTLSKGLGGGLPIGAFLCGEKTAEVLSKGQHGTTFGGNPVACAGALEVILRVSNRDFLRAVREKGELIIKRIGQTESAHIKQVRGRGLMIGIMTDLPIKEFSARALEHGLIVLTAGADVIRLLPPLNIAEKELDKGLAILCGLFERGSL